MRWNRVAVLGVFVFLSLVSAVNAADCPNDIFTIFRLSNESNAHIASWNFAFYNVSLCLQDLNFDLTTITPANLESTMGLNLGEIRKTKDNGENTLIRGYSENNTHASVPNFTAFPINFSYGDLVCKWQIGNLCDTQDRKWQFAASLKSTNNSHVNIDPSKFNVGDSQGRGGDVIICCYSKSLTSGPEGTCGNNIADGDEYCDGGDLRGQSCQTKGYEDGTLRCKDNTNGDFSCTFDVSGCFNRTSETPFCDAVARNPPLTGTQATYFGGSASPIPIGGCQDYNLIREEDKDNYGSPYNTWDLEDFQEQMCNQCHTYVGNVQLQGYTGQSGINAYCYWNNTEEKCETGYAAANGQFCKVTVINDPKCAPGQDVKYVKVLDTCDLNNCGPNSVNGGCDREVICPKSVELPFFDWRNFIAVIALLGMIYFAYHRIK